MHEIALSESIAPLGSEKPGGTCSSSATNQNIGHAQLYTCNTRLGRQDQSCTSRAGRYLHIMSGSVTSSQMVRLNIAGEHFVYRSARVDNTLLFSPEWSL